MTESLLTIQISYFRRLFGSGLMIALSVTLVYAGANSMSGNGLGILLLLGFAALAFFAAWKLFQATEHQLILTAEGIKSQTGEVIVDINNIESVDKSFFAFKPSNGFLLRLKEPMPRGWVPGLWWRYGRRVGIGGATTPGHGKAMADLLTVLLSDQRDVLLNPDNQT